MPQGQVLNNTTDSLFPGAHLLANISNLVPCFKRSSVDLAARSTRGPNRGAEVWQVTSSTARRLTEAQSDPPRVHTSRPLLSCFLSIFTLSAPSASAMR